MLLLKHVQSIKAPLALKAADSKAAVPTLTVWFSNQHHGQQLGHIFTRPTRNLPVTE